jgi:hypothetical protein
MKTLALLFIISTTGAFASQPIYRFPNSVIKVKELEEKRFKHCINDSGEIVVANSKFLQNKTGFPSLNCDYNNSRWFTHPKNRFLALSELNHYYVIDSLFNIIVDASDSIIAISKEVWENYHLPCSNENCGGSEIYYQAFRNGLNNVLDYEGDRFIEKPFEGKICQTSYYKLVFSAPYYTTIKNGYQGAPNARMGLIDSTGSEVLAMKYRSLYPYPRMNKVDSIWIVTGDSPVHIYKIINVISNQELLVFHDNTLYPIGPDNYEIKQFTLNDQHGLYHPVFGVILSSEYSEIDFDYPSQEFYITKMNGRRKKWKLPKKIIELYL